MSELGRSSEKLLLLKKRRGGFKATVNKLVNDIYALVEGVQRETLDPVPEQFDAKFDAIDKVMSDVQDTHSAIVKLLFVESDIQEAEQYVQSMYNDIQVVRHRAFPDLNVKSTDSASQVASKSDMCESTHSSISMERVRVAAKAASLAVAAERLREMQALEMEELALKQKKAALELDTQWAVATAKKDVYDSELGSHITRASKRSSKSKSTSQVVNELSTNAMTIGNTVTERDIMNANLSQSYTMPGTIVTTTTIPNTMSSAMGTYISSDRYTMSNAHATDTVPPNAQVTNVVTHNMNTDYINGSASYVPHYMNMGHVAYNANVPQTINVTSVVPKHTATQVSPPTVLWSSQHPVTSSISQAQPSMAAIPTVTNFQSPDTEWLTLLSNNQQQQQRVLNSMDLPKVEMIKFDGDPLKFWLFVKQFDNVNINNTDDNHKLLMLLQYCTGKARHVIECCAAMEPAAGYCRARELLKQRFGDEFVIAESWINKVADGPAIAVKDRVGLQSLADDLRNCVINLTAMSQLNEVNTQRVLLRIVERLPSFIRNRWIREVQGIRKRTQKNPDITDLSKFVDDAAAECNDPVYCHLNMGKEIKSTPARPTRDVRTNRGSNFNIAANISTQGCDLCRQNHTSLFACDTFKAMSVDDRRKYVMNNMLCFNCLKPGHGAQKCTLMRTCSVPGCGLKHTKFLHITPSKNDVTRTFKPASATCSATGAGSPTKIALPIIPVKVRAPGTTQHVIVHCLLDSGSTSTFSTESLAVKLGIQGSKQRLTLTTLEKQDSTQQTTVIDLEVAPVDSDTFIPLDNVYTREVIPIKESNIGRSHDLGAWPHLRDLNLPTVYTVVMLLIGQDQPDLLLPREVRSGGPGTPYATRSILGWTVNGPLGLSVGDRSRTATANFIATDILQKQVEHFWKVDDWEALIDDKPAMSVEDNQAVDVWRKSIKKDNTEHYTLDIPFRSWPPGLTYNRVVAENRLRGLKRKLSRDDNLAQLYNKGMQKLIDEGHAERVTDEKGPEGAIWYLPHHPVLHHMKPGRVRIVFDCSAVHNGVSLNDRVMQGPDMTNSLLGVLLRFRQERVCVKADIEGMFHQVHVTPKHRDLLRFLWWPGGNMNEDPVAYRMTVHLFGGTWSPSCCGFALQHTAKNNSESFGPEVINSVVRDFYVDDLLASVSCEEDAIALVVDLKALLHRGGFNLTKWTSNSRRVLGSIPEEDRAKDIKGLDLNFQALPVERALGVSWNVDGDSFQFIINPIDKPLTRRGLLSVVSSIYDPIGFLAPFTVTAKKIIQDLTREKVGWDEALPDAELNRWMHWVNDLPTLSQMSIPRCYKLPLEDEVIRYELHHFSDASEMAYGVVSYLRMHKANGQIHCALVLSKSRLSPIKSMTIPRMELAAASLAVQLNSMLLRELDLKIAESTYWTDSSIVLSYIANVTKRYQTYVSNRIALIHRGSTIEQWRHIESSLNPADEVSRGLSATELITSPRWIAGPPFLYQRKHDWPSSTICPVELDDDPEVKHVRSFLAEAEVKAPTDILIERYSSWYRLGRAVACILRVKGWLLCKIRKQPSEDLRQPLSVNEIDVAEAAVIMYVQRQCFKEDISAAENGSTMRKSKLNNLKPVMSEGLLSIGGRLRKADLPGRQKHPIILPKRHHIVTLVVKAYHESSGHVGREHVLSLVRQRFWIVAGRQAVRRVIKDCFVCKRSSAQPATPKMADLPSVRLQSDLPPFTFTGVDLFGPILIKRGRSEVKRYGCLFTCLTVRAVHIEVAHSLDTDSFINALQRFISRRGSPREIWCDNGTNFVGAEKELRLSLQSWNQTQIHDSLLQRQISWHFNPPKASHMGGVWERMIRTVRKILNPLLKEQTMDDESLATLLCTVEAIINGRPLTQVSDDPEDLSALSPNQLLVPGTPYQLPPGLFRKEDQYIRRRWRQVQYFSDVFWRRWTKEYLPILQTRTKWFEEKKNIAVGDIVLLVEETHRNSWPLARVLEVYPGDDGIVRSVKLKTRFTTLVRPVTKICFLEATE